MIPLGEFHTLTIQRRLEQGFYLGLAGSTDPDESVLLPNRYITEKMALGDQIDVFIYNDSEDRIVATTLIPKITLNRFACLKVVSISRHGAFLDWGLAKDLFVPFREQAKKMEEGEHHIVFLYIDKLTNRLVASSKLHKFLDKQRAPFRVNDEVELMIAERTDLGVNVIINEKYKGVLYENEIFQELVYGERLKGYIKKVREDNKIDVRLQRPGYGSIQLNEQKILERLKENKGFLPLNDYSTPEDIIASLSMSKKVFKKSIGSLFKQRLIRIEEKGIYLTKN